MHTQSPMEIHLETLMPHRGMIDAELIDELNASIPIYIKNVEGAREEGRNLRIAVVGQMKAGKSSFLNAAFFGRDMLPKADTPMTAALTTIAYASSLSARVIFYNQDDWRDIVRRAEEYRLRYIEVEQHLMEASRTQASPFAKPSTPKQPNKQEIHARISDDLKASAELVEKARLSGLNVAEYVGKEQLLNADSEPELAKSLHNYVGSGGKYTAITKMIMLHTNDNRLEGLEIIDTPGFNDPVLSRGQITRSYLGKCDVIFLLSSLSQFLTEADMSLLREQLSVAGINEKAIFLVGSQRDVALRQDSGLVKQAQILVEKYPAKDRKGAKVAAMIHLLDSKMAKLAAKTLDDQINRPNIDDKTRSILNAVKQATPSFISAWTSLIAKRLPDLSPDDSDQLQALCRDTDYPFDAQSLELLSNISTVTELVVHQRIQKEQLLAGKERALFEGAQVGTRDKLEEMQRRLLQKQSQIRDGNIATLAKQEQDAVMRLERGRAKLEDRFDDQVVQIRTKFAKLKTGIRGQALRYSSVEVIREESTESYQVDTSIFGGLFGHDWETRYRNVVSHYANVQDAIEQIERYALETAESLQNEIIGCVNVEALRRAIEQDAMSLFDTENADFDSQRMLSDVKKSLRKITIPEIDFGSQDYAGSIITSFGNSRVSESEIDSLKQAQRVAIATIIKDMEDEVNRKVHEITKRLEDTGATFVADISSQIQTTLSDLRDGIANKERSLQQIDEALKCIEKCLVSIQLASIEI